MESAEQSQSIHLLFLQLDPTECQVLSVESWQNLTIKDQRIQKNGNSEILFSYAIKQRKVFVYVRTWCFMWRVETCSIDQRKDSAQKQTQNHRPLHSQQTQPNKAIDPMLNFK